MSSKHLARRLTPGFLVGLALATGACGNELDTRGNIGGANQNIRKVGNIPGGWRIDRGDIAIHPDGKSFFTVRSGKLFSGATDGSSLSPVSNLSAPDRLAFLPGGPSFVALKDGKLFRFDQDQHQQAWEVEAAGARRVDVSPDGKRVLISFVSTALLIDADSGATLRSISTTGPVRDVDFLKNGRIFITSEGSAVDNLEANSTRITVVESQDGAQTCETTVDNCAGEVEFSPDEQTAFLSPTVCNMDPISVLSLANDGCRVEETTPGFGPVALSPDGNTVVAFLDRDIAAPGVPEDVLNSPTRYHLMFMDAKTREFTTMPVANDLPRFAFTPDGSRLLVDLPLDPLANLMVVDVAAKALEHVKGPPLKLNAFSFSPDSSRAFIVDNQLFNLDLKGGLLKPNGLNLPLAGINVTPEGPTLMVSQLSDAALVFLDAISGQEKARRSY